MRLGVLQSASDAALVERLAGPLGVALRAVDDGALRALALDALVIAGDVDAARWPALTRFAQAGGPVLGLGAGCGALCRAGLLEGEVVPVAPTGGGERFCVVEGRPTPFTHAIPAGRHLRFADARVAGRYAHPAPALLEAEARVVLRYCSADGEVAAAEGSLDAIAGICNPAANVVGLLLSPSAQPAVGDEWRSLCACLAGWRGAGVGRV